MEGLEHSSIGSSSAQAVQVDELADQVDQLGLSHPELDFVSHDVLKSLSLRHAPSLSLEKTHVLIITQKYKTCGTGNDSSEWFPVLS